MNSSTELNRIEIREGWKGYYLFCFVLWMAILIYGFINPGNRQITIDFFFKDLTVVKVLIFTFLFGMPTICLYFYFDKKLKIRIDNEGIWKQKHTAISWNDISGFSSKEIYANEGDIYKLIITLNDETHHKKKQIEIELRRVDKEFTEIRDVITYYLNKYEITDSGHKKSWF